MRYLGIDPGAKRTGLAMGDDETGLASPLASPPVAPNGVLTHGSDAERLAGLLKVIDREAPDALVLGLPLNMDGTAGPSAEAAQRLAATLRERSGLSVHLQDERRTSMRADDQMARTGLTHGQKKARRDALAAAHLLRDFLARAD